MNYAEIKHCDIANGVGVRTTLFVSGCRLHCPDCFNEIAWDFSAGKPFDDAVADAIIESLEPGYISGLSVLGGEPMEPENQQVLLELVRTAERVGARVDRRVADRERRVGEDETAHAFDHRQIFVGPLHCLADRRAIIGVVR